MPIAHIQHITKHIHSKSEVKTKRCFLFALVQARLRRAGEQVNSSKALQLLTVLPEQIVVFARCHFRNKRKKTVKGNQLAADLCSDDGWPVPAVQYQYNGNKRALLFESRQGYNAPR